MTRVFHWLERLIDVLVALGILFISGLVFSQFFSRYVFNFSLTWSEEVATFVMIWAGLLGLVGYLRHGDFIGFNLLFRVRSRTVHAGANLISQLATTAFMILIVWLGLRMSLFSASTGMSSAAQIPLRWIYTIYPVFAAGVLLRLVVRWFRAIPDRSRHEP